MNAPTIEARPDEQLPTSPVECPSCHTRQAFSVPSIEYTFWCDHCRAWKRIPFEPVVGPDPRD